MYNTDYDSSTTRTCNGLISRHSTCRQPQHSVLNDARSAYVWHDKTNSTMMRKVCIQATYSLALMYVLGGSVVITANFCLYIASKC